jgi:hypothetical protein
MSSTSKDLEAFMVEWPDGSRSSVKGTLKHDWSLPKGTQCLSNNEKQDSLV